ncbi:EF-P 5-aminopentanol modification-associated protein YfmF [Pseudalkalibacillus caeni]|uniref:Insulinase family protein n=1 Tax=Exobacillus caeni TaxID=2574798 RepID=A0A5R9F2W0_9BACL|nr:pitrilysin family protein [Pseudalkalibacillus caeni]TLS37391.1 insulinase family protein [Pseudalkalibacillus caeni]
MTLIQHEATVLDGIKLHTIQTDKYKTNTVVLQMKAPLKKDTVTKRALLPYVLQSGTENLPSTKQVRRKLEELYGASLYVDLAKKGDFHVISIRMDISNEKFLSEQSKILSDGLQLLSEILLNPKTEQGSFDSAIVQKEKRTLKQRIQSIYDDKMRYSNMRLTKEMFPDEPFGLHIYGELDMVDSITGKELYEYYQKAIQEDSIDLYLVGDLEKHNVSEIVKKTFSLGRRGTEEGAVTEKAALDVTENEVIESQDIKQGKLHMGYRTGISYKDEQYYALQVFNGIFGGFSHSKLFRNVREKESLAYYAASRYESHKGLLIVMSGIETKNYDKTVSIIKEQLEAMRSGDFSEEEMGQTKTMINNQLLETIDDAKGMVELLYHEEIAGYSRPMEDWLDGIEKVTKEKVVDVAKQITLDTVYFLKGEEA